MIMTAQENLLSLDLLDQLISFDTTASTITTSDQSNLPLIEFVQDYLGQLGVQSTLTYDQSRRKANLFATIGPSDQPGVILSGHTDVVSVQDQNWTVDPFSVTERDGRLYGRGTADMKGFIATILAFSKIFVERDIKIPVHYALSYDEEIGALGVPLLIEDMKERVALPIACIVGEPSYMRVVTAHKGKIVCRAEFRGKEAHTGVPHIGANAIEAAGKTIAYISNMGRQFRDEGPYDKDFEAPIYTTVQVCIVEGGIAVNTVPNFAGFDFDIRYLPCQDPYQILSDIRGFMEESTLPELRRISTETSVEVIVYPGAAIALDTPENDMIALLAKGLTGENEVRKVGFGTEAGYFQQAGIPTVVCGPGHVDQAHQPDEFVELEQVALCEQFFHRLTDCLCEGHLQIN